MHFKKFFQKPRNLVVLGISLMLIIGLVAGAFLLNRNAQDSANPSQTAQASGTPFPVYRGQLVTLAFAYKNAQGEAGSNPMQLDALISKEFDVNLSQTQINDVYPYFGPGDSRNGTPNCIDPSLFQVLNTTSNWGYRLLYRPRSATSASNCSGDADFNAPVSLDASTEGAVIIKVRLKNLPTSFPEGFILDPGPLNQQGARARITTKVGTQCNGNPLTGTNTFALCFPPDAEQFFTIRGNEVTLPDPGGTLPDTIGTGDCNASVKPIGPTFDCTFQLVNGAAFFIPGGKTVTARVSDPGISNGAGNCVVNGAKTQLICTGLKTQGATPGARNIILKDVNNVEANKGNVTLASPNLTSNDVSSIVCTPNPGIVGQPQSCNVILVNSGPFTIPPTFQIKIGNAPGTLCNPNPGTVNGTSFICNGISTVGAIPGSNPVGTSLDNFVSTEGQVQLNPNENDPATGNIVTANCTTPITIGQTTTCNAVLNATNLRGSLIFALANNAGSCTATVSIGSPNTTCNIQPNQVGSFLATVTAPIAGGSPFQANTVVVNSRTITTGDVASAFCTTPIIFGQTTNCSAVLNSNTLSGTLTFTLANGAGTCNATVNPGSNTTNCAITPSQVGSFLANVTASGGGSPFQANTVVVNPRTITTADIRDASCTSPVVLGANSVCTANLVSPNFTGSITFILPDTTFCNAIVTSGSSAASCNIRPISTGTFPVVANASGGGNPSPAGNITVTGRPIDDPTITDPGSTIQNLSCVTDPTLVNTTTVCTGNLKPEFTQPANVNNRLKVKLNNIGSGEGLCTFSTNSNFTCAPNNVGSQAGQNRQVLAAIASGPFTNAPDTVTVTNNPNEVVLIERTNIIFNPGQSNPSKFGQNDLTIGIQGDARLTNGATCTFEYRQYPTANNPNPAFAALGTSIYNGTNCSTLLPRNLQAVPRWQFKARVTGNSDGRTYGADPDYFMLFGAIGVVSIGAS